MLALEPATTAVADVIGRVRDDQLADPTPCTGSTVGDLLDHVDGFCAAFTAAARKAPPPQSGRSSADAANLGADWRDALPRKLAELAAAWSEPDAWSGTTHAGGLEMPAATTGLVALDEVIVHGWDIAAATGQRIAFPDDLVQAAAGWVEETVAAHPLGSRGLFGPPVDIPNDAPPLDRLLGRTGRDPSWQPT